MGSIANILFDFGNVIIDIDIPGAKEKIAAFRNTRVPEDKFERHVLDLVRKYEVDAISTAVFVNGILKHSRPSIQARDVIAAWNSMLVGIPKHRLEMLERLRDDYKILLLSNTNALHIEWVYNHLQDTHKISDFDSRFFHKTFYSHIIGLRKPDPAPFNHVVREMQIAPSKTLFIDDMAENIEVANHLGFRTMLSPPEADVSDALKLKGYF